MNRPRLIDWSRHQAETNLQMVVDEWGIIGVIFRCTIGWSYFDPWYQWNFAQAVAIKEKLEDFFIDEFFIGAYHVLWPWNRDPLKEAKWFKDHIKVDGVAPDFVVDDMELPNTKDGWSSITPKEVGNQIVVQLPAIEQETGLRCLSYSGSWWWNADAHLGSVTPLGVEKDYPLIEAEYTDRWYMPIGSRDFSEAPEFPTEPATLGRGWTLADLVAWQWTSRLRPVGVQSKSQDGSVLMVSVNRFKEIIGESSPDLTDKEKLDILWTNHPEFHPPD
jgi:GH25 family lysozyme M1 (1,4-beta-N-acetylmuramidase)